MNPRNPWSHAKKEKRDYLTPEDIGAAIEAGAKKIGVYAATLKALESGAAEDPSLCAYVALRGESWTSKKRYKALGLLEKKCPECGSPERRGLGTSYYDKKGNHDHMNAHICNHAWHGHDPRSTGPEVTKE